MNRAAAAQEAQKGDEIFIYFPETTAFVNIHFDYNSNYGIVYFAENAENTMLMAGMNDLTY